MTTRDTDQDSSAVAGNLQSLCLQWGDGRGYKFMRSTDQTELIFFLGAQIPGKSFSTSRGDITAAVTRDGSGTNGGRGSKERWEVRDGKVHLFMDGRSAIDLTIQGHKLLTDGGAVYVRQIMWLPSTIRSTLRWSQRHHPFRLDQVMKFD